MDNETINDVIASFEAEYVSHTYNCHNIHQKYNTIWYDYVDIDAIDIHG